MEKIGYAQMHDLDSLRAEEAESLHPVNALLRDLDLDLPTLEEAQNLSRVTAIACDPTNTRPLRARAVAEAQDIHKRCGEALKFVPDLIETMTDERETLQLCGAQHASSHDAVRVYRSRRGFPRT